MPPGHGSYLNIRPYSHSLSLLCLIPLSTPIELAALGRVAVLHVISEHAARMGTTAEAFLVMLHEMAHMPRTELHPSSERPRRAENRIN